MTKPPAPPTSSTFFSRTQSTLAHEQNGYLNLVLGISIVSIAVVFLLKFMAVNRKKNQYQSLNQVEVGIASVVTTPYQVGI